MVIDIQVPQGINNTIEIDITKIVKKLRALYKLSSIILFDILDLSESIFIHLFHHIKQFDHLNLKTIGVNTSWIAYDAASLSQNHLNKLIIQHFVSVFKFLNKNERNFQVWNQQNLNSYLCRSD
jgi:hypothetical protein